MCGDRGLYARLDWEALIKAIPRPIAWALPIFASDGAKLGDPYIGNVNVTMTDDRVAVLTSFVAHVPENGMPAVWDAIMTALASIGATHYQRTRIKKGKIRTETRPIRKIHQ